MLLYSFLIYNKWNPNIYIYMKLKIRSYLLYLYEIKWSIYTHIHIITSPAANSRINIQFIYFVLIYRYLVVNKMQEWEQLLLLNWTSHIYSSNSSVVHFMFYFIFIWKSSKCFLYFIKIFDITKFNNIYASTREFY